MHKSNSLIPSKTERTCPFDGYSCVYPCNKLLHARMDAGLSDDDVISKIGTHRMTWWRYRSGQQKPPLAVCGYLSALAGIFHWPGWRKFNINVLNGKLFRSDLRDGFTPGDVASIFFMRQELHYWRSRARPGQPEPVTQTGSVIAFPYRPKLQDAL